MDMKVDVDIGSCFGFFTGPQGQFRYCLMI